jgi:prevent-host-death family protein
MRMDSYNLADAKARLSELVDRAAAGEDIQISKRGAAKVRLVPVEKPRSRLDVDELRRLTAEMPMGSGAAKLIRDLRDEVS